MEISVQWLIGLMVVGFIIGLITHYAFGKAEATSKDLSYALMYKLLKTYDPTISLKYKLVKDDDFKEGDDTDKPEEEFKVTRRKTE